MGIIRLTINRQRVEVDDGTTLLEAARSVGLHIPALCHYPGLPANAVCRMCLVEVAGETKPVPACKEMAVDGAIVETETADLRAHRETNAAWLLARHPNDCIRCEVSGACQLQTLVHENQWEDRWARKEFQHDLSLGQRQVDHTSPSIWRDLDKCIECGLCADVCGDARQHLDVIGFSERGSDRRPVTAFDKHLSESDCISCGQCTLVCPVGALIEAPHWHDVLHTLDARERLSVVQVAPATRVAISEEFGLGPGTVSTGRLINALRALGFDYVFDTNFAADLTIMEEGSELLNRVKHGEALPLFTSCCPGWVNWVEINRPDLIPHLSTTKSPQQMHGALTKRGSFARALGSDFEANDTEPYVVSVMPCTAKKDEALHPGMSGDVDHVLTTRELARMIRSRDIAFGALPEDGTFDSPLGESTGAAQIFGASGGVMEAMARTAVHLMGEAESETVDWYPLRGVLDGIKEAVVPGLGTVAVCNGIAAAQRLLETEDWRSAYAAIEVMACVGGCLGGGGEPKSMDPDILKKRAAAIYEIDRSLPRRRAHENRDVQQLYEHDLGSPNSSSAHALLHTSYAPRHSKRLMLARVLDAVDRRDAKGAADLFHPEGVWSTSSPLGDVTGREAIADLISQRLPPRQFGTRFFRHRLKSPSDGTCLQVIAPNGELCEFQLDLCTFVEGTEMKTGMNHLTRIVLSRSDAS